MSESENQDTNFVVAWRVCQPNYKPMAYEPEAAFRRCVHAHAFAGTLTNCHAAVLRTDWNSAWLACDFLNEHPRTEDDPKCFVIGVPAEKNQRTWGYRRIAAMDNMKLAEKIVKDVAEGYDGMRHQCVDATIVECASDALPEFLNFLNRHRRPFVG